MITMLPVLVSFLAALSSSSFVAGCGTILPPTQSNACELISQYDKMALVSGTKTSIQSIIASLRSFNDTLKTDPDVASLSHDDFDTFNPADSTADLFAVGKSGWIIQECYYPILVNVTGGEYRKKMDCPDSNQYSNQTWIILENLSDLSIQLKKLAKTNSVLSEGPQCAVITNPICIQPNYNATRAADSQLLTKDQIRVRNVFSLMNTLLIYLGGLERNTFFN